MTNALRVRFIRKVCLVIYVCVRVIETALVTLIKATKAVNISQNTEVSVLQKRHIVAYLVASGNCAMNDVRPNPPTLFPRHMGLLQELSILV